MSRRSFNYRLMQLSAIGVVVYSASCLAAKPAQQELSGESHTGALATPRSSASAQPAPLTREAATTKLQAEFQALDTNKDGYLSQSEIAAGLVARRAQLIAAIRKQREAAFLAMDTNKDGQLSRDEFLAGGPKFSSVLPDGSKALSRFDLNKDGKVSLNEYLAVALANFDKANTNKAATSDAKKKAPQR
jgi:Ca2+-binding EF-hand superfamily protein